MVRKIAITGVIFLMSVGLLAGLNFLVWVFKLEEFMEVKSRKFTRLSCGNLCRCVLPLNEIILKNFIYILGILFIS